MFIERNKDFTYPFKTVCEYFVHMYRIIMVLDCRLHAGVSP